MMNARHVILLVTVHHCRGMRLYTLLGIAHFVNEIFTILCLLLFLVIKIGTSEYLHVVESRQQTTYLRGTTY